MSSLSVIIPTWREADGIGPAVVRAAAIGDEVIVADGGSPDGTGELARAAGARVVIAAKGRGAQLDEGARAASGDVLLFLHADVEVAAGARAAILDALAAPDIDGGNFRIAFHPRSLSAVFFDRVYDVGRRLLRTYYGDSGLFIRRGAYQRLGGFRSLPLFEDYDLVRRLEARGQTVYLRDVVVRASARRFARAPVSTFVLGAALQAAFSAGVPAHYLARIYRDAR